MNRKMDQQGRNRDEHGRTLGGRGRNRGGIVRRGKESEGNEAKEEN